jgi:hypothetical protein
MKVGIGIPNTILGASGEQVLAWARRAEARGFSTLATIGRVVYPGYGELVALAAAAGSTERIGLMTNILLAPAFDPIQLAKDTASLDQLSGGRFTLGIGVGARPDDSEAVRRPFGDRGRRTDELLELLHRAWAGEDVTGAGVAVGPAPASRSGRRRSAAGSPSRSAVAPTSRLPGPCAGTRPGRSAAAGRRWPPRASRPSEPRGPSTAGGASRRSWRSTTSRSARRPASSPSATPGPADPEQVDRLADVVL